MSALEVASPILSLAALVVAVYAAWNARGSRVAAGRSARAAETSASTNARLLELRERELSRAPWRLTALTGGQCAAVNDGPVPVYDVSVVGSAVRSEGTVPVVDGGGQVRFYDVRDYETTDDEVRVTWRSTLEAAPQIWRHPLP